MSTIICTFVGHEWFALSYPPARRDLCERCGLIREAVPDRIPEKVR